MSTRSRSCFVMFAIVALLGPVVAHGAPATRGAVVVSGNELTSGSPLRAIDGKVYLDDIQVWPAVSLMATKTPNSITPFDERCHLVSSIVRSQTTKKPGQPALLGPAVTAVATFRQYTDVVDSSWVDPNSGLPWVKWKNGHSEEFGLDDPTDGTPPTEDVATTLARALTELRNQGTTIYAGDGYLTLIPAVRRAEFQNRIAQSMQTNAPLEAKGRNFRLRYLSLIRDQQNPVPLSSLRQTR